MKIGSQLTNVLQKIPGLLFFGPPCRYKNMDSYMLYYMKDATELHE